MLLFTRLCLNDGIWVHSSYCVIYDHPFFTQRKPKNLFKGSASNCLASRERRPKCGSAGKKSTFEGTTHKSLSVSMSR